VKDFDDRWAAYIATNSLEEFQRIIVGKDSTLNDWEKNWTNRILQLDPNQHLSLSK
jgi:hypothetical protein